MKGAAWALKKLYCQSILQSLGDGQSVEMMLISTNRHGEFAPFRVQGHKITYIKRGCLNVLNEKTLRPIT